jgi:hypothetical protein
MRNMKKLIIIAFSAVVLFACNDKKTETEETTITTETTTDLNEPGPDENSTTVTKTVETDSSEMSVTVGEAQPTAIDSTKNRRKQ